MPFKKGHSGYKPKGAKGKKTEQWEQLASTLTGDQADEFTSLMGELWSGNKADKLLAADLFIKMVEYFKPKQARVETIQENEVVIKVKHE